MLKFSAPFSSNWKCLSVNYLINSQTNETKIKRLIIYSVEYYLLIYAIVSSSDANMISTCHPLNVIQMSWEKQKEPKTKSKWTKIDISNTETSI